MTRNENYVCGGSRRITVITEEDLGYVTVMQDSEYAIICNLFVAEEYRANGLGSALFQAAMDECSEVPTFVDVCGFDDNCLTDKQLFEFYAARGFKRVDGHPFSMRKDPS